MFNERSVSLSVHLGNAVVRGTWPGSRSWPHLMKDLYLFILEIGNSPWAGVTTYNTVYAVAVVVGPIHHTFISIHVLIHMQPVYILYCIRDAMYSEITKSLQLW